MTGVIRVGLAKEIVPVLRGLGADPEDVIGEAGLDPGLLADENNIIPYAALGRVFAIGAEHTQCPHLGLLVGAARDDLRDRSNVRMPSKSCHLLPAGPLFLPLSVTLAIG